MSVVEHCNDFFTSLARDDLVNVYGMVVLNSETPAVVSSVHNKLLRRIWSSMSIVGCADGGANRLYDEMEKEERGTFVPQFIAGDLDSIRSDVSLFYK
jgi:Thiamin pyrophosphokinase, catalytic domain